MNHADHPNGNILCISMDVENIGKLCNFIEKTLGVECKLSIGSGEICINDNCGNEIKIAASDS